MEKNTKRLIIAITITATPTPMPAWAPVLKPFEGLGCTVEDGEDVAEVESEADETAEDVVEVLGEAVAELVDPGMSVAVLTVGTADESTVNCA